MEAHNAVAPIPVDYAVDRLPLSEAIDALDEVVDLLAFDEGIHDPHARDRSPVPCLTSSLGEKASPVKYNEAVSCSFYHCIELPHVGIRPEEKYGQLRYVTTPHV